MAVAEQNCGVATGVTCRRRRGFRAAAGAALMLSMASGSMLRADDWPFYRGPNGDGASKETGWSATWPGTGPKVAWEKEVGIGASSVVVVGNRVLTMGNRENKDIVVCLNAADGQELWQFAYACKFDKRQFDGGTASTPTVDGEFVYTLSYDGQLHCLQLADGKLVWKKHMVQDFGGTLPRWKYACSPLVEGDLLIVDIGGTGNSTLALNKGTGAKIWGSGNDGAGYASPAVYSLGGTRGVIVCKGKAVVGLNLKDGKELWRTPWETSYDVNASTPIVLGDTVFISSGYKEGRGALLKLAATEAPTQLWRNDTMKTKTSSCVVYGGNVYGVMSDISGKPLMCVSLADGKPAWSETGFGAGTLALAGDTLVVLSEKGELVTAKATPTAFTAISRAQVLPARVKCWVQPVLANGRIYCRNNKGALVCLDVR